MGVWKLEDLWESWCPYRVNNQSQPETCLGKRCMQWRWTYPGDDYKPSGYCGLSGEPAMSEADVVEAIKIQKQAEEEDES